MKNTKQQNRYLFNRHKSHTVVHLAIILSILVVAITLVGIKTHMEPDNPFLFFRYFTTLSNILASIGSVLTISISINSIKEQEFFCPNWLAKLLFVCVVSISITFFINIFLIVPTQGAEAYTGTNFYFHYVCPILFMILFAIVCDDVYFTFKDRMLALLPVILYSIAYVIMVIVIGEEKGGWPDFYYTTKYVQFHIAFILVYVIFFIVTNVIANIHNYLVKKRAIIYADFLSKKLEPEDGTSVKFLLYEMGETLYRISYNKNVATIPLNIIDMLSKKYPDISPEQMIAIYLNGVKAAIEDEQNKKK